MIDDPLLKVAVAQIDPRLGDLEANLKTHLDWLEQARAAGAQVVVFPELSLTGYDVGERAVQLAIEIWEPLEHPVLRTLAEAAGDMYVVAGFVEEGHGAQLFNAAAMFHRGRQVFIHRKLNLANYGDMSEAKLFASGRYIETFDLPGRFVGAMLLCSDTWNPALVHIAALHGATVLIVPTNSSLDANSGDVSKPERWDLVLRFYASLYGLAVVFCNRVGKEGVHTFWGGSRVLDPFGNLLVHAGRGEELLVAELRHHSVREARFRLPTVRDSNLDLIQREIERLSSRIGVPSVVRKL